MSQRVDLTGRIYGRLTAVKFIKSKNNRTIWLCQCNCGNYHNVDKNNLENNTVRSCGCLLRESSKIPKNKKHGLSYSKIYSCWNSMKMRCDNPRDKRYKSYGAINIGYDPRWKYFKNFYKDMHFKYVYAKKKYRKELSTNNPITIERRNVNGNYCFENCEFIPRNKQSGNRKNNKIFKAISPKGDIYIDNNYSNFVKKHELCKQGVYRCLHNKTKTYKGWKFNYISGE